MMYVSGLHFNGQHCVAKMSIFLNKHAVLLLPWYSRYQICAALNSAQCHIQTNITLLSKNLAKEESTIFIKCSSHDKGTISHSLSNYKVRVHSY